MSIKLYRVILQVSDIERAARFYAQVFDFPGQRVSKGRHYFDCDGTILACFDPRADGDPFDAAPNPDHVYLAVDDLDACFERVKQAGCTSIDDGIATQPWSERMFYAKDPFGNPIAFVDRGTVFTGESLMSEIENAVEILRRGGLVAFPTETVYGLGADATNPAAIAKIFQVKGRPATNPLICHIADESIAHRYAQTWPLAASRISNAFWPGPITIVVAKSQAIVDAVTAEKDTVGLRVPNHPLTLELLKKFDGPLAGPSANRSTHVSPTTARHVRDELGDAVDLILDGGPCSVGIESTVLDLSGEIPTILRPGGISKEQIEGVIGPVKLNTMVTEVTMPAKSPGQHAVHYAPSTPTYRFDPRDREKLDMTEAAIVELTLAPETYARNLYARLRLLDTQSLRAIYVEMPPDLPEWAAIRDRLLRATKPLP